MMPAKTAFGFVTNPTGNSLPAMISLLFIVLAVIYGYVTNRMGVKTLPATIGGIIGIVLITVLGLNVGFAMTVSHGRIRRCVHRCSFPGSRMDPVIAP